MRRLGSVVAALALTLAMSAVVHAQSAAKTTNAQGSVSATSPTSMSVKGKAEMWTFMIDKATTVVAKGATHTTLAAKADGKNTVLTDFVKNGDTVTVEYHDLGGGKLHAARINVTTPKP